MSHPCHPACKKAVDLLGSINIFQIEDVIVPSTLPSLAPLGILCLVLGTTVEN